MQTWASIKGIPPAEIPPGVYSGVPFPEYAMLPFLNYSKLKHFHGGATPAHARYALTHEKESDAKSFGLALHLAIFEPHRLDAETVVAPKVDRRFKEGKKAWAQYEELAKGRMILDEEQMAAIEAIRASARANATVNELLTNRGVNEMTFVWDDPEFKVRCKGRADRYTHMESWPIVADLKSFGNVATRFAFERQAHQLGYWLQAAFYSDGLDAVAPTVGEAFRRFVWIVAEVNPPHCVRVFEADSEPLEWGRIQYRKAMRTWAEAQRTGSWPGWGEGIELLGLPGWVTRTFVEEG